VYKYTTPVPGPAGDGTRNEGYNRYEVIIDTMKRANGDVWYPDLTFGEISNRLLLGYGSQSALRILEPQSRFGSAPPPLSLDFRMTSWRSKRVNGVSEG